MTAKHPPAGWRWCRHPDPSDVAEVLAAVMLLGTGAERVEVLNRAVAWLRLGTHRRASPPRRHRHDYYIPPETPGSLADGIEAGLHTRGTP